MISDLYQNIREKAQDIERKAKNTMAGLGAMAMAATAALPFYSLPVQAQDNTQQVAVEQEEPSQGNMGAIMGMMGAALTMGGATLYFANKSRERDDPIWLPERDEGRDSPDKRNPSEEILEERTAGGKRKHIKDRTFVDVETTSSSAQNPSQDVVQEEIKRGNIRDFRTIGMEERRDAVLTLINSHNEEPKKSLDQIVREAESEVRKEARISSGGQFRDVLWKHIRSPHEAPLGEEVSITVRTKDRVPEELQDFIAKKYLTDASTRDTAEHLSTEFSMDIDQYTVARIGRDLHKSKNRLEAKLNAMRDYVKPRIVAELYSRMGGNLEEVAEEIYERTHSKVKLTTSEVSEIALDYYATKGKDISNRNEARLEAVFGALTEEDAAKINEKMLRAYVSEGSLRDKLFELNRFLDQKRKTDHIAYEGDLTLEMVSYHARKKLGADSRKEAQMQAKLEELGGSVADRIFRVYSGEDKEVKERGPLTLEEKTEILRQEYGNIITQDLVSYHGRNELTRVMEEGEVEETVERRENADAEEEAAEVEYPWQRKSLFSSSNGRKEAVRGDHSGNGRKQLPTSPSRYSPSHHSSTTPLENGRNGKGERRVVIQDQYFGDRVVFLQRDRGFLGPIVEEFNRYYEVISAAIKREQN